MNAPPDGVKLTAILPQDAAPLISKLSGFVVTESMILKDLEEGAPRNEDGTINIVQYAAWLLLARRK